MTRTRSSRARLLIATHNAGKRAELERLLAPWGRELRGPEDFGLEAPDEDGESFEVIALDKARLAARKSGIEAIADDTGLCVDALEGAPGLHSARFAEAHGGWEPARLALARQLGLIEDPGSRARAHFMCAVAWAEPGGRSWVGSGHVSGWLAWPERGEGPGFVRIFRPDAPPFWREGVFEHRRMAFEAMMQARGLTQAKGR